MPFALGFAEVPVDVIVASKLALRQLDQANENYQDLITSMQAHGFQGVIQVRNGRDAETGQECLEIVDGLHRYSAAKAAGLKKVFVQVVEMTDMQVMSTMIAMNSGRVPTKPAEFARGLQRMISMCPTMTHEELARKVGCSVQKVLSYLNLNNIANETIINAINDGKLKLGNALALARLKSTDDQVALLSEAMTDDSKVFAQKVGARISAINKANRSGTDPKPIEFVACVRIRTIKDIETEIESATNLKSLLTDKMTPIQAAQMALKWVLSLDPQNVAIAKAKFEADQKAKAEERERKRKEKEAKKEAEAKEIVAKVEG